MTLAGTIKLSAGFGFNPPVPYRTTARIPRAGSSVGIPISTSPHKHMRDAQLSDQPAPRAETPQTHPGKSAGKRALIRTGRNTKVRPVALPPSAIALQICEVEETGRTTAPGCGRPPWLWRGPPKKKGHDPIVSQVVFRSLRKQDWCAGGVQNRRDFRRDFAHKHNQFNGG